MLWGHRCTSGAVPTTATRLDALRTSQAPGNAAVAVVVTVGLAASHSTPYGRKTSAPLPSAPPTLAPWPPAPPAAYGVRQLGPVQPYPAAAVGVRGSNPLSSTRSPTRARTSIRTPFCETPPRRCHRHCDSNVMLQP